MKLLAERGVRSSRAARARDCPAARSPTASCCSASTGSATILSIDAENGRAVVEPGVVNATLTPRRRPVRPALRARSVEPDGVHDRRQRGRERGRAALPQVRRDAEPRARGHRAAARRRDRHARQRRRRDGGLRPARRLRRAPKAASASRSTSRCGSTPHPAGGAHAARRLLVRATPRRRRCRRSSRGHRAGGAGDDGPGDDPRGRGVDLRGGLPDRCGGGAADRARRGGGRARRRRARVSRALPRGRRARRARRAPTPPIARGSGRDARRRSARWDASRRTSSCRMPSCRARGCPRCSRRIHAIGAATRRAGLQRVSRGRRQPAPEHRLRRERPGRRPRACTRR